MEGVAIKFERGQRYQLQDEPDKLLLQLNLGYILELFIIKG